MLRQDGRDDRALRKVKITADYLKYAEGSCLIELGSTKVVCSASVEDGVPHFLRNSGTGWVTGEYGMLPRSCKSRTPREASRGKLSGRTHEIQRLIGRSFRSVVNTQALGERTIWIDADVIQGDGGTRTASVTGGFIALALALKKLRKEGLIDTVPLTDYVAAVSVGIIDGRAVLDLAYEEDSKAEVDMNVVMTGSGKFIEIQGTAEGQPFLKKDLDELLVLAKKGIEELIDLQKKKVEKWN